MANECSKCRFERERQGWLYADESWKVFTSKWGPDSSPVKIIPGMTTIQLRRHATVFELEPPEWATLGPLIGHVTHAVRNATGAECVYWMALGEGVPHFHINFVPRGREIPESERGIDLLGYLHKYVDDSTFDAMGAKVGDALRASIDAEQEGARGT